jgi:hypothetical protein
MSGRDDFERDIAEEDEVSALLRSSDARSTVPPFSEVTRRAEEHRNVGPGLAFVAAALLVAVVVAGIGGWRAASTAPTSSPAPSPTLDASASGPPCFAPPPGTALVGARPSGQWLQTSLDAVQPTDPQTNQLRWVLRFMVPQGAPAPATVFARARISVSTPNDRQHILGYEITEPQQGAVADSEALSVKPCNSLVLVVRMAGPLIDGTFPYTIAVEKVALPEGGTVTESFDVRLACSNRTRSCVVADAAATAVPTPAPVAGVLKPDFGIIYNGVRTGWEKGSAPLVRREGEATFAVGELAPSYFNQFGGAVTPDGRRAAYFAQRQNEPWAMFLIDGARPNEQRLLRTFPDDLPAAGPVWSADGDAVAFVVINREANQGVKPNYSAIRTLDLVTGVVTELARVTDGSGYTIVGWDRANGRLAAMIAPHGQAPTTYVVFSGTGKREWTLEGGYSAVAAPNGRDVAAILCQGPTIGCSFWTWKLEDFDTRVDQKFGPGLSMGMIGWRPGTDDVGVFVTSITGGGPGRIELWSAAAGRRVVFGPSDRVAGDAFFRADGSALVLTLALDEAVVVDLASGRTSPLPLPTPQAPWEIGRMRASIRLGS